MSHRWRTASAAALEQLSAPGWHCFHGRDFRATQATEANRDARGVQPSLAGFHRTADAGARRPTVVHPDVLQLYDAWSRRLQPLHPGSSSAATRQQRGYPGTSCRRHMLSAADSNRRSLCNDKIALADNMKHTGSKKCEWSVPRRSTSYPRRTR